MASFPLVRHLPAILDSTGWEWQQIKDDGPSNDFWVGTDLDGNRWLTKLKGAFSSYREVVFSRVLQSMGWHCQSSVFLRLDPTSAKHLISSTDVIQAAHWMLNEHKPQLCSSTCPYSELNTIRERRVEDLDRLVISNITSWPKSDMVGCLFGGLEPSGRLFTREHECVIIDGELAFTPGQPPCGFEYTGWLDSRRGIELAIKMCEDASVLTDTQIDYSVDLPEGVFIEDLIGLRNRLFEIRSFAEEYGQSLRARL